MKRSLLIVLLFFCFINVYGQSITLLDLSNLTSLNLKQADDYFAATKRFKLQFGEEVNGFIVEHYQTPAQAGKQETVIVGTGFKTASGAVLYAVSYETNDPQDIINLINQTKHAGLLLTFQGADDHNNIYIYDSFLYHVIFRLSFNQTTGIIDLTQKQVFAY
jgi:hypothetical protein